MTGGSRRAENHVTLSLMSLATSIQINFGVVGSEHFSDTIPAFLLLFRSISDQVFKD